MPPAHLSYTRMWTNDVSNVKRACLELNVLPDRDAISDVRLKIVFILLSTDYPSTLIIHVLAKTSNSLKI